MTHLFLFMQCNLDTQLTEEILRLHLSWRVQQVLQVLVPSQGAPRYLLKRTSSLSAQQDWRATSPSKRGTVTLHPKMIWAHGPQDCPWAEERTGITEECLKPASHYQLKEGYSQHLILVNKSSGLLKFLSYSLWCCSCEYLDAGSSAGHWHLSGIIHIVKKCVLLYLRLGLLVLKSCHSLCK